MDVPLGLWTGPDGLANPCYACITCLLARLCKTNIATLGVVGDSAITHDSEAKETPHGLTKWTPNDVI